jgi:hypothetical protein
MTMQQWLESLKLDATAAENYEKKFADEEIKNPSQLVDADLTIADFQKLNVKIAHRHLIVKGIEGLRKSLPQPSSDDIADARFDLIVRFVAVAISVGFATRLSQMGWLTAGHIPGSAESQELLRLCTALFVIVSGWEWYHRDVVERRRPLKKWPRFVVDLMVVAVSLGFLLSSKVQLLWLAAACVVFFLYLIWDALCVREFPSDYGNASVADAFSNLGKNKGIAANVGWFLYLFLLFWITFVLTWRFSAGGPVFTLVCCAAVVAGVTRLRFDAGTFRLTRRATEGFLLLAVYTLLASVVTYTRIDPPVAHWLDSFQPKLEATAAPTQTK